MKNSKAKPPPSKRGALDTKSDACSGRDANTYSRGRSRTSLKLGKLQRKKKFLKKFQGKILDR